MRGHRLVTAARTGAALKRRAKAAASGAETLKAQQPMAKTLLVGKGFQFFQRGKAAAKIVGEWCGSDRIHAATLGRNHRRVEVSGPPRPVSDGR